MGRKTEVGFLTIVTTTLVVLSISSCQNSTENTVAASSAPKTLYVASGLCSSGPGITTYSAATASRAVSKWSTETGNFTDVFTDLNIGTNVSVGTVPQDLIDKGSYMLMLTENATTTGDRKIFKLDKSDTSTYVTYASDPTAFTNGATHITRSFSQSDDGSMYFSKSLFIERLNSIGIRLNKGGANPWINPTAATGNCFTAAASLITRIKVMAPYSADNPGKVLYLHAGATAATNRIGIISKTGLTSGTAADCIVTNPAGGLSATAHTNATGVTGTVTFSATGASPVAMVYIPTPSPASTTAKLIVAYSASVNTAFDNNTNLNYAIVMWDITETSDTAATIANPVVIYNDVSVIFGASAMAYDSTTNSLYLAVGGSPGVMNQTTSNYGYNVEKFTLDINTPSLTRIPINNKPFIIGNAYTKCVSSMVVAD